MIFFFFFHKGPFIKLNRLSSINLGVVVQVCPLWTIWRLITRCLGCWHPGCVMDLPALFIHQRSSQSEIISQLFTAAFLIGAERTKTLINLKRALGKLAGTMIFSLSLQQLWLNSLTQSPGGIPSYVLSFSMFIYLRIIAGFFLHCPGNLCWIASLS